jgi:hypothetical protein
MKHSSSSSFLALQVLAGTAVSAANADAGVISMPIRFLYGALNKITTPVVVRSNANASAIEVVVDFGSSDFWVCFPCFFFFVYLHTLNM